MSDWQIRFDDDVAIISRDDGKANAMLSPDFKGLMAALDAVEQSKAQAVVLTGRPGFLSAGLNLKAIGNLSLDELKALVSDMGECVLKLHLYPKPVVTAVSGHALGGGAMLALAADACVFADGPFKFGLNEVAAGLFVPSFAIEMARASMPAERLTQLVGHGRTLSPTEALAMGLAEAVHAPDDLLQAAILRARELGALSGGGYALTKRLLRGPGADSARQKLPGELAELARMLDSRHR